MAAALGTLAALNGNHALCMIILRIVFAVSALLVLFSIRRLCDCQRRSEIAKQRTRNKASNHVRISQVIPWRRWGSKLPVSGRADKANSCRDAPSRPLLLASRLRRAFLQLLTSHVMM